MNTLTYLSRQFDVVASPRSPQDQFNTLKRVKTWSTKSFLFPPPVPPSPPKRSFSSPADFISLVSVTKSLKSSSQQVVIPSKSTALDSVIRRLFFIRFFILVCRLLCAAWSSVAASRSRREPSVESGIDTDGKDDSDHEVQHVVSLPSPAVTTQALISPSTSPSILYFSRIHGLDRDLVTSPMVKEEPDLHLPFSSPVVATFSESPPPLASSRTSTPASTRKTAFNLLPKTLVLDLDETLIHSTSRPIPSFTSSRSGLLGLGTIGRRNKGAGHMVEVVMGGRSTLYHVYKRPFVDFFLRTVSGWYTLVIFTASMQEYADPVIDWLDAGRGILARRLFRDSCTLLPNGSYTKNLSVVEQDLSRVCLVDNSPISYRINEANGIPIEGWTHDPSDEALLDLLPVLDSLRFTNDVRRVLGIRGFS